MRRNDSSWQRKFIDECDVSVINRSFSPLG